MNGKNADMKEKLLLLKQNIFHKEKLAVRVLLAVLGVFTMGFSMSVLEILSFGTDPFTCMNIGISSVTGLSLGTVALLVSAFLFLYVIFADISKIGIGTLVNMVGFGYTVDLFRLIWRSVGFTAPPTGVWRILLLCVMLAVFILAVAVYLAADLGSAPYDATPEILSGKLRIRFVYVRIVWDVTAVLIGFFLGSKVGVTTVVCAFLVGPAAAMVRRAVDRMLK